MVPIGNATASATAVVTRVPSTSGMMAKGGGGNKGGRSGAVRNSFIETWAKNVDDSYPRINTIPSVIATEERAARNSSASINRSLMRESRRWRDGAASGGCRLSDWSAATATG